MTTQEKVESQIPGQNPEFVHIPKDVHREAIISLLSQSVVYSHLNQSIHFNLFEIISDPTKTALELMGFSEYATSDKFYENVNDIIDHHADMKSLPVSQLKLKKIGLKVYKSVKFEIERYNRKSACHE